MAMNQQLSMRENRPPPPPAPPYLALSSWFYEIGACPQMVLPRKNGKSQMVDAAEKPSDNFIPGLLLGGVIGYGIGGVL